jgi:hypothetical protein
VRFEEAGRTNKHESPQGTKRERDRELRTAAGKQVSSTGRLFTWWRQSEHFRKSFENPSLLSVSELSTGADSYSLIAKLKTRMKHQPLRRGM